MVVVIFLDFINLWEMKSEMYEDNEWYVENIYTLLSLKRLIICRKMLTF